MCVSDGGYGVYGYVFGVCIRVGCIRVMGTVSLVSVPGYALLVSEPGYALNSLLIWLRLHKT